jgi:tetratricopeptide (TPR) repeat protein
MVRNACAILLLALLPGAPTAARAQAQVVNTFMLNSAEPRLGSEYRAQIAEAVDAIARGDAGAAVAPLRTVRAYCDAQQRPGRRIVSVADEAEYDQYIAGRDDGEPTEWIDIACPSAYHFTGYLEAGAGRLDEALPWLERAIAIAPYFPDARNERGFVLAQLGRLDEALAAYRETLALADAHPSAVYIKPLSLRGIGYVLIEMGDLDGAQRAYEESLELDPGNGTATSELAYIAKARAARVP